MTDWEEKTCQLCYGIAGLYHRRERLISEGDTDRAEALDEPLSNLIDDLKSWLYKNEKE